MNDRFTNPGKAIPLTFVKVGGSLLSQMGFPARLECWLGDRPVERRVFLVGGGSLVEQLRTAQGIFKWCDEFCHWSAIRIMSETARWYQNIRPELPLVSSENLHDAISKTKTDLIVDSRHFMESESQLPRDWSTTSDSIAAELAVKHEVNELCLLKSISTKLDSPEQWLEFGLVDANFPQVAESLPLVSVHNLGETDSLSIEDR